MIQINELRIGNIVVVNNHKSHPILKDIPLRVIGVHEHSNGYVVSLQQISIEPNTYYETYSQKIQFIDPVPLTEELLLKCGFVRKETETAIYLNYGTSLLISFPKDDDEFLVLFNGAFMEHIDSLHQLQNLYFASTGEELKIKL